MISLATIPKPFEGHVGVIQRNALASWRAVLPGAEIVVFGDEPGAGDAAAAVGARFVPDVERNEYGTPLLGSTFRRLAESSSHELLAYVNADIVLLPDFVQALARVSVRPFLLVSRRWNLDVREPLDLSGDWAGSLRARVRADGELLGHRERRHRVAGLGGDVQGLFGGEGAPARLRMAGAGASVDSRGRTRDDHANRRGGLTIPPLCTPATASRYPRRPRGPAVHP